MTEREMSENVQLLLTPQQATSLVLRKQDRHWVHTAFYRHLEPRAREPRTAVILTRRRAIRVCPRKTSREPAGDGYMKSLLCLSSQNHYRARRTRRPLTFTSVYYPSDTTPGTLPGCFSFSQGSSEERDLHGQPCFMVEEAKVKGRSQCIQCIRGL